MLNGEPIKEGAISFRPVDGKGPSFGSMIRDGAFYVEKAAEGEKIAVITAIDADQLVSSREDMANLSRNNTPFELIPPNAAGNNQKVVIESGAQTMDFAITTN